MRALEIFLTTMAILLIIITSQIAAAWMIKTPHKPIMVREVLTLSALILTILSIILVTISIFISKDCIFDTNKY